MITLTEIMIVNDNDSFVFEAEIVLSPDKRFVVTEIVVSKPFLSINV